MAETSQAKVVLPAASLGQLVDALKGEFPDPPALKHMLARRAVGRRYEPFAHTDTYELNLFSLVQAASDENWIGDLISAALDERPTSTKLLQFLYRDQGPVLEAGVVGSPFVDFSKVEAISRWVCRLQSNIGPLGTATLIGPDLIITNGHVYDLIEQSGFPSELAWCVFDHKGFSGGEISLGRRVELDGAWKVLRRGHNPREGMVDQERPAAHELDYAILRLKVPVGNEPVGKPGISATEAPPRGWLRLFAPDTGFVPDVSSGPLFIFQHPRNSSNVAQPLQISSGAVMPSPWPELRMRYAASTLRGSSGSPCFNSAWDLVGLHHAAEYTLSGTTVRFNQGIPLVAILQDLAGRETEFTSQGSQLPWKFSVPTSTHNSTTPGGIQHPIDPRVEPDSPFAPTVIPPLTATILGRPPRTYFVNRTVLRSHLRLLVQGETDCRLVSINGLPCTGKGHSRYLIEHAARGNPRVKTIYFYFPRYREIKDACRFLVSQMAISPAAIDDLERKVLIDAADPARIGAKFTTWLAELTSQAAPRLWWFIIDGLHPENSPDPALREHLIDHWIEGIRSDNRFTQTVLFLLGEDTRPDLDFTTLPDSIDFLRREELGEFFRNQATERGRELSAKDLEMLVNEVAPSGNDPLTSEEMLQLQNRLRRLMQGNVLA